ncbi:MAG: four helix bundle protein [Candidatus Cloacimonas sp.]|jgi:four helix bundle protein|nr:four helix bundle protein [Candidatus Cloacimonas sp.]
MIESFKDLFVWQKAMDFAEEVYNLSKFFPKEELYALTNQIHRAVVSIPSNIAEGKGRNSLAEYLHFLAVAQGSLAEVETQILLAIRFGYITKTDSEKALAQRDEISRMLVSLRYKLSHPTPVT